MRARSIAVLAAALVALSACAPTPPTADEAAVPPVAAPTASPTPPPADDEATDFGDAEFNDRGNLIKQIGQSAGMTYYDTLVASFVVTEIMLDLECTSGFANPPANGHYLGVKIDIETLPELANADFASVTISPYDWQVFDSTGMRLNDAQGNAWSCLDQSQQLPTDLGPGQRASGWIVLDVAQPTGSIALVPIGYEAGWEWAY